MNKYCTKTFGLIRFFEILSLEKALDFIFYWNIREIDIHVITPYCYELNTISYKIKEIVLLEINSNKT